MNRTWNLITTFHENIPLSSNMTNGEVQEYFNLVDEYVSTAFPFVEFVYDSNDTPKLPELGINNNYVILYIDPANFNLVSLGFDNSGVMGRIKLKDFPTLTFDRPYLLFLVLKVNQIQSSNLPDDYKAIAQGLALDDTDEIVGIEPE